MSSNLPLSSNHSASNCLLISQVWRLQPITYHYREAKPVDSVKRFHCLCPPPPIPRGWPVSYINLRMPPRHAFLHPHTHTCRCTHMRPLAHTLILRSDWEMESDTPSWQHPLATFLWAVHSCRSRPICPEMARKRKGTGMEAGKDEAHTRYPACKKGRGGNGVLRKGGEDAR